MRRLALTFALLLGLATSLSAQAEVPKLTIAAQTSGTVNWELQTIISHGFDKANGFELVVIDAAGSPAAQIAFSAVRRTPLSPTGSGWRGSAPKTATS